MSLSAAVPPIRRLLVPVLLLCGCTPRPSEVAAVPRPLPRTVQKGPFSLELSLQPTPPRYLTETRFILTARSADGQPLAGASATVELTMDHPMPPNRFPLTERTPGSYEGTGSFAMGGDHEAVVTIRKRGVTGTARFAIANVLWEK